MNFYEPSFYEQSNILRTIYPSLHGLDIMQSVRVRRLQTLWLTKK